MRDAAGVTKSSWRITVRQLESLVRLSEAMAKMYCSEEVFIFYIPILMYLNMINYCVTF